ncbi:hypothetical protein ACH5RR_019391 [Cinchona calisaya]|uniref:Uncharacterized protein n=1 Tax=Cinchona calisaya TaxID=153742 RepID=A0ABD2ZS26_9GENT
MAATVSTWAKPRTWGDFVSATVDFPSLATVTATKSKEKSRGQTLSLQELTTYRAKQPQASKGPTRDELIALATGTSQCFAEELKHSKLGRGFRSYENNYDMPNGGFFDEQPRQERDSSCDFAPS